MAVKHTKYENMYDTGVREDGTRTIRPSSSVSSTTGTGSVQNNQTTSTPNGTYGGVTISDAPYAASSGSSNTSNKVTTSGSSGYSYTPFTTSQRTNDYAGQLAYYEDEDSKPTWSSKYEDTISGILDNILNRQAFDLNTDANYNQLYNNYAERYQAQAQRSMNDTMAAANAATGGYGSTYGGAVAQQAYDQTMEGLNDRNMQLAQLAYQMYGDNVADNYNQLSAVQGLDNTDYSRYRDDVGDYYTDRNYYANQYNNSYNTDYSQWANDRDFDYGTYTNDRTYDNTVSQQEYERYQDALSTAMGLSQKGLSVPDYITSVIDQYNTKYGLGSGNAQDTLAALAAQVSSAANSTSGSKSKSSSPASTKDKTNIENEYPYDTNVKKVSNTVEKANGNTAKILALYEAVNSGSITEEEMDILIRDYNLNEASAQSDTKSTAGKKLQELITENSKKEYKSNNSLPTSLSDIAAQIKKGYLK